MPGLRKMSWWRIIQKILRHPPHEDIEIPKYLVLRPEYEGFRPTIGEPRGQLADYELTLPDGRRVHVREYEDVYRVHWDHVSPLVDPIGHLVHDAPHWFWGIFAFGTLIVIGIGIAYAMMDK